MPLGPLRGYAHLVTPFKTFVQMFWGGDNSFGSRVRRRIFWFLITLGIASGYTIYYHEPIYHWLLAPAGDRLSPFDGRPVYIHPLEMLNTTIRLALRGGLIAALPVAGASALVLANPLFGPRLRRFILVFIPAVLAMGLAGAAFAYYVVMPASLGFLLGRFGTSVAQPMIGLSYYIDLLSQLVYALAFIFQIPPAMFISARMGVVGYRRFRLFRRYYLGATIFLAIFLSPGADPYSMLMLLGPMWALYEVGLFAAWIAKPSDGNYLWAKTFRQWLVKLWDGIIWLPRRPVVIARWVYRKVKRTR